MFFMYFTPFIQIILAYVYQSIVFVSKFPLCLYFLNILVFYLLFYIIHLYYFPHNFLNILLRIPSCTKTKIS